MAGGFPLQKWVSNNSDVLKSIPLTRQLPQQTLDFEENSVIHTLGLSYKPSADTFHFTVQTTKESKHTKRTVLSQLAKLFDPLGFISPVTVKAKILMQKLWIIKLGWDDDLPSHLAQAWQEFLDHLSQLSSISIPRWLHTIHSSEIQIHGFSDASQSALGAVVYLRSNTDQTIKLSLICSKTKVSPLKRCTIPRLELSAAVLMTRLVTHTLRVLELQNVPVYLWTDSSIVHTWVSNHPSRWKEYVHNRVCHIQESLPHAQWRHIPGKENPADCASRGLTPLELSQHAIWWHGPSWLAKEQSYWPRDVRETHNSDQLEEKLVQITTAYKHQNFASWELLTRYHSLSKLLRITVYCMRAVSRFKSKLAVNCTTPITPSDLENAKIFWIRHVQTSAYQEEINIITSSQQLPKTHRLARLTPFIDKSGLLRVGGRLENSILPYESKHPFILPKESYLSSLIIADAHERTLHGSTQSTLSYIRASYWIMGGRAPVRSFILKCVRCTRYRKLHAQQLMGQLPSFRVTPTLRPFLNTGLDYAGPFNIKTWSGRAARTYKAYISLFVCHATSAIHLELVTDYTAEAFLAAYRRFTARRGICQTLSSDCGTNFKGADAELKNLFSSASKQLANLKTLIANDGTKWIFNPPGAPHFGGKWEAGIRSVKHHLRRVVGDHLLTYEEFTTLLAQVESVLNSRPLCPLTDDPDDLAFLTPGHFLIGQPLNLIPEPAFEHLPINRLSRWQRLRQMITSFWNKWSKECLQRYQAIYKWNQKCEDIKVGTLVLVLDERYPPSKWPLGRVVEVHPGKDNLVRVATVKTMDSTLTRPIVELCPLPIDQSSI